MDDIKKQQHGEFLVEYRELTLKYKLDFINYPVYVVDEKGGFTTRVQTQIVDLPEPENADVQETK